MGVEETPALRWELKLPAIIPSPYMAMGRRDGCPPLGIETLRAGMPHAPTVRVEKTAALRWELKRVRLLSLQKLV